MRSNRAISLLAFLLITVTFLGTPRSATAEYGDITLMSWYRIDGGCALSDVHGWYDVGILSGNPRHYAVVGQFPDNLYIIDVDDPTNPQLKTVINSIPIYDIKVWTSWSPFDPYQVFAYGADGEYCGPQSAVYELTKPGNPVYRGATANAHNNTISDGGYLFASPGKCYLKAFDLNVDPIAPPLVFSEESVHTGLNYYSHDVMPKGGRLYDFSQNYGVDIFDISGLPGATTLLGTVPHGFSTENPSGGRGAHSGDVSSDGNYLYVCDEARTIEAYRGNEWGGPEDIYIYDISDPANAVYLGNVADPDAGAHNLYVVGDLALVSYFSAGFKVFSLADPANPVLLDEYDTNHAAGEGIPYGTWGVYLDGRGYVYVSDKQNGLFVFAVEGLSPAAGTASGPTFTPGISGRVTFSSGLGYPYATINFVDECETFKYVTDAQGYYSHYVPYRWQGTATIEPEFTFDATGGTTADYSMGVTSFMTGQDWTRDPPPPCRKCPDPIQKTASNPTDEATPLLTSVPNPFNPSTTIQYRLTEPGAAVLRVYDVAGRLVRSVTQPYREAGTWDWQWNGRNDAGVTVAAGTYMIRLTAGERDHTHRVTLLK